MNNTNHTLKSNNGAPRVAVLYCQNSVKKDANIASAVEKFQDFTLHPAIMPCSSKIQVPHILKILDQEADGVEIVACPDKKCRFLDGSCRSGKRVGYARKLLDEINAGAERLGITYASCLSEKEFLELASKRARAVKELLNQEGRQ